MAQMKKKNKNPEKELNEMEISNLSDAEFKTLVMRMLKEIIGYYKNINRPRALPHTIYRCLFYNRPCY